MERIKSPDISSSDYVASILILRHGEQEKYGNIASPLTQLGRQQILDCSQDIVSRLKSAENNSRQIVAIRYSDRIRTIQSANIIEENISNAIQAGELENTCLMESKKSSYLRTADALAKIMSARGLSAREALSAWLTFDDDILNLMNVHSPTKMGIGLVSRMETYATLLANSSKKTDQFNFVWVTHETSHIAIMRLIDPQFDLPIKHAEALEGIIDQNGNIVKINFRNNLYSLQS